MSETLLTIEDAARCLPALVDGIHEKGEAVVLLKSGRPIARIVPVNSREEPTKDLVAFLREWRLKYPEADDEFAQVIEESRRNLHAPRDPWE
jgi:antitoxin (DNA-binding transcriptional repressor) of toxin-antitoxin stability system